MITKWHIIIMITKWHIIIIIAKWHIVIIIIILDLEWEKEERTTEWWNN